MILFINKLLKYVCSILYRVLLGLYVNDATADDGKLIDWLIQVVLFYLKKDITCYRII